MSLTAEIRKNGPSFSWLKSAWMVVVLTPLIVLLFDPAGVRPVIEDAVTSLISTIPFVLFAITLVAYLKAAGAEAMIAEAFKGRETRMIFVAALFGGLAPFCSCEVIPFVAGLLALGAPLSAVMAFWLASPLIDPPTVLITAAALGWPLAIAKTLSAVGVGLMGGFVLQLAMKQGLFADPLKPDSMATRGANGGCGCGPSPFDSRPVWKIWQEADRRRQFGSEWISNGLFLIKWLAVAYILQGVLVRYVPSEVIIGTVGGDGLFPIMLASLVGIPAYLNGYVAPPLLAGFVEQGMSQGAALSFMVAGAVTCIPAMAAVWSLVKPQVFASYLGLGLGGAVLAGVLFQLTV